MKKATIITGMGYGDEGKGSVTDYITRRDNATLVVLHNGGSQRAHNVVTPCGKHHTFSQFGSGTLVRENVATLLGRRFLFNPVELWAENEHLIELGCTNALDRLYVDYRCPIITPFHVAANRLRELQRQHDTGVHGSCGQGIGETMMDVLGVNNIGEGNGYWTQSLRAGDLAYADVDDWLKDIQERKRREMLKAAPDTMDSDEWEVLQDDTEPAALAELYWNTVAPQPADKHHVHITIDTAILGQHESVVFEGGQGVLLDQDYGFHPYTTWSKCTDENAFEILQDTDFHWPSSITRLGVTRSYMTRHGAGPFVTEAPIDVKELHNNMGRWQGKWKVGVLDLKALEYATRANGGFDEIAVTHMDQAKPFVCDNYLDTHTGWVLPCVPPRERVDPETDPTQRQSKLTELLFNAKGEYRKVNGIIYEIEQRTGVPVTIASWGPTSNYKKETK